MPDERWVRKLLGIESEDGGGKRCCFDRDRSLAHESVLQRAQTRR